MKKRLLTVLAVFLSLAVPAVAQQNLGPPSQRQKPSILYGWGEISALFEDAVSGGDLVGAASDTTRQRVLLGRNLPASAWMTTRWTGTP